MSSTSISAALARFTTNLRLDDVPQAVRERAKHLILDSIGLAFATTTFNYSRATLAAMQELDSGHASVFAHSERLAMRDAMLFNGLLIHGLDFDDTHARGVIHSTASALPCVFGLGERENASGADLLAAYLCAMEVSTRVGAVAQGGFHKTGFHPTGLAGAFGCTLAAARLLGLDEARATHAQGIALSMASGSLEFLQDGAWTKRLHPGWAAVSGTVAASLAKHGFVGPGAPYEGRYGLYSLHLNDDATPDLSIATNGLGEQWEIDHVALKPIPACHFTHASSDAAVELHKQHGLSIDEIENVVVRVPGATVNVICEPVANKKHPANSYDAQFSIPYIVATGLLKGRFTLDDLDDAALADPAVLALAQRVNYEVDHESTFPRHYTGEVIVFTRDGRRLAHREAINRGSSDRPLTNDDIVAKFFDNAQRVVSRDRAAQVRDAVLNLERSSVSTLADVLRRPG
ncbi:MULTISPECIES: MmgE/PrpD family protein [Burkholderiaceae]|uniref:Immune-responsive protein 1 n=1 Tax=Caballeronia sordidicola TaxID=196367 RepID=A0A242N3N0_CABSO|nr:MULTISPECIES: MmgE/PrpD family protein [Burkholderiaceae]AMH43879.1 2-methylcitrate dehydratase [Burkholderia sp. PAMC 26561]OTP78279.1 Immune-responsive protein 1 [Caballeronia sordidicola]